MSNQSDRPNTPDYQCDTDNIESRPIASSSNTLSQTDRPGAVMSSQTDSGVESNLVVIDTGNITDKDSEHSHAVNERIADSESKSWNDETPWLDSGHWLSSYLEFASYFPERLTSMHMYYESTWGSFTGTQWNLNVRTNWNILQRMQTDDIANLNISNLMFHFGTLAYTIVESKLAWNILILVQQSLGFYRWLLGVLFFGVGVLTCYLVCNWFPTSDRGDVRNLFPTVFVWTTVLIGVSLTVLISWELVAFVMGIYT
ncbi:uncharacterized protein C8R40DRAFT_1070719 [Lentinula edodes]|uniref:uncharacterized protein n=1 Tax=Lentinula edodes TaxID=5353 RepID=UPI001E8D5519|nr:uncharacterized protein C8R40DRAFT_1070719 [Lentinula edodes]KAH7873884.1 hypothetical protein C8R40DRAFT_1070719 [Lentinula edodes]